MATNEAANDATLGCELSGSEIKGHAIKQFLCSAHCVWAALADLCCIGKRIFARSLRQTSDNTNLMCFTTIKDASRHHNVFHDVWTNETLKKHCACHVWH